MNKNHVVTIVVFVIIIGLLLLTAPKKTQDIISNEQVVWEYNLHPLATDIFLAQYKKDGKDIHVARVLKGNFTDIEFTKDDNTIIKIGEAPKITKYIYKQEITYKSILGTRVIEKDLVKFVVSTPIVVFADYNNIQGDMKKYDIEVKQVNINDF